MVKAMNCCPKNLGEREARVIERCVACQSVLLQKDFFKRSNARPNKMFPNPVMDLNERAKLGDLKNPLGEMAKECKGML